MPEPILHISEIFDLLNKPYPADLKSQDQFKATRPWYSTEKYSVYAYQCWLNHLNHKIRYFSYASKSRDISLSFEDRTRLKELVAKSELFLEAMRDIKSYTASSGVLLLLPDKSITLANPQQVFVDSIELLKTFNDILLIPNPSLLVNRPHFQADYDNKCVAFLSQAEQLSKHLEPGLGSKIFGSVEAIGGGLIAAVGFSLAVAAFIAIFNPAVLALPLTIAALQVIIGLPVCIYGLSEASHGYKFFSGWHSRVIKENSIEVTKPNTKQAISDVREEVHKINRNYMGR